MDLDTAIDDRLRRLADSLDCLLEEDLLLLAGVTHGTAAAWRKRGIGPPYVRFGNVVLYPRRGLRKHLDAELREPRQIAAVEVL
jgi:hypothetical protein